MGRETTAISVVSHRIALLSVESGVGSATYHIANFGPYALS